ncbi:MAG: DUF6526 family protein [Niabella sp.]
MGVQHFKNHVRYYPAHHFVFYPVTFLLTFISGYKTIKAEGDFKSIWLFITIMLALIIWVSYMLRQHYALTLQNRLVRLEMRHKYSMLTGKDFEPLEDKLSFGQIAALRFASDEELVPLVSRALKENLSPKAIKESIASWKADYMRV